MTNQEITKAQSYAAQLISQVTEMFQEESENFIDLEDFNDESSLKAFIHALSNLMPAFMYNKLTGGDENHLSHNHIANHLCFEHSHPEK